MKTRLNKTGNFRNMLTLAAAVAVIFSIQSCDLHEITYPEPDPEPKEEYVSFSASIQPIFNSECIDCHSGSQSPNLSEGSSYASLTANANEYIDTDNPESSLLYTKPQSSAHKMYWTPNSSKLNMILEWIKAGAPND